MKNMKFALIMAASLLMIVGTASATVTEFHLTEEDANVYYNGDIDVKITVDDVSKTVELEILEPNTEKVSLRTVLLNVPADKIVGVIDYNDNVN